MDTQAIVDARVEELRWVLDRLLEVELNPSVAIARVDI
jgi:hypothetical protein